MNDDRNKAHHKLEARLFPLWERWGKDIANNSIGRDRLTRRSDFGQKTAATLCRLVRDHGPVPNRTGVRTILVVGDPHAKPHQSLERFRWLGRLVIDVDPDVVVCVGDWADCHATGRFDRGKLKGQTARHLADMEAANEALRLFHREIDDFNESCGKYRTINPRLIFCVGNHEHRMDAFVQEHPMLEGLMGVDELDFAKRGWEVAPFLEYVEVDGVYFSHYIHGKHGRATSGIHHAYNMTRHKHRSVVVGHSHALDYKLTMDHGMDMQHQGLVCGCYFEDWEDYAHQSNDQWWKGICVLRDVHDGRYDLSTYSMDRIRRTYGDQ